MAAGPIPSADRIPILMYHAISPERSSTSIPLGVFADQMQAIADAGWNVAPLSAYAAWRLHGETLPERTLVITFDDAYQDFADEAFPVLQRHGFAATVFVPTSLPGRLAAWPGAHKPHRPIMSWETIRAISGRGVEFAPHSRTHANLADISGDSLRAEIAGARTDIEQELGVAVRHFAPPYGESSEEANAIIEATYDISVGVRLGVANRNSPRHATPRIEMLYYCSLARWKSFLAGKGGPYLLARQAARAVRRLATPGPRSAYG